MTYTATIRQRGQLTIPDKLRETLDWLREGSVVEIVVRGETVIIRPYRGFKKK